MRSNTTLHLRSGAVLEASRDPEDFDVLANDALEPVPPEEFAPGVVWQPAATRKTHDHLLKSASRRNNAIIRLYRAHDAKIIGEPGSVIDGRDSYDPLGGEGFRGGHGSRRNGLGLPPLRHGRETCRSPLGFRSRDKSSFLHGRHGV